MKLTKCHAIEAGSRLGAFSPSDWLGGDRPERSRAAALSLESAAGLKIEFAPNAFARDGIRAGTIDQRISDLDVLLDNELISGLIATYGGKACNQIVTRLPFEALARRRLPMFGFSDVAVLQNAITAQTGLVTFYGPNILAKLDQSSWGRLDSLVAGSAKFHTDSVFGMEPNPNARCVRAGRAVGRLFGGNLECFVYGNLLSKQDLSFFNQGIFFWESGGLTPREADQALTALANSGFLSTISGMIIGDAFTQEGYEWFRSDPLESVLNATASYRFPVLHLPIFGHKKLENPIIPIGVIAEMDAERLTARTIEDYIEV